MSARLSSFQLPLAEEEILRKRWIARLTSPITWSVYAVLAVLLYFLKPVWWVGVLLFLCTTAALWFYWRLTGEALKHRVLKKVITKSNLKQDHEMTQRLDRLRKQRAGDLAITLGKFLELKREIEVEVTRGESVPEGAGQVEAMIDELCYGIADELDHLAQVQGRLARPSLQITDAQREELEDTQREIVSTISQAYKTLSETRNNIDAILHPTSLDLPQRDRAIEDVVGRLKEEADIARRVRQRLDQAAMKAGVDQGD